MAHSPGPWRWVTERVNGGSDTGAHLVDADGESVMLAYNPSDAALIAAAPRMWGLLKRADDARECFLCGAQPGAHGRECELRALIDDLKKAGA